MTSIDHYTFLQVISSLWLLVIAVNSQVVSQQPQVLQTQPIQSIQPQLAARPPVDLNNIKPLIQAALAAGTKAPPPVVTNVDPPVKLAPDTQVSAALSYGNEDPIVYLDYSSFNDEILKKQTANFVYFNANFNHCRHCHKFFNIWKELAVDIRWWKQVIKLFSINCSDEDNIEVCRRAGVTQFPQVKYYWVMSSSLEQDGQRVRVLGKSVHAMRHLIMDKVLDSYKEHNKILAQRKQQRTSPISPPGLLGGAAPSAAANPLASLMGPMMSQMMSGSGGGLGSIMSALSGKGGFSLTSLMGSVGGPQGLTQLMNAMMSAGSMRQRLSVQPLPSNWPELEQMESQDSQQLIEMLPQGNGALLIMETQEFLFTGLEVMLDLSPYGNQTYLMRVRDDRSQLSKNLTKRDDVQAPALIYVSATKEPKLIMTAPKYTNDEDLRRAFVRNFERRQIKYPVKRVWSMPPSANQLNKGNQVDSQEDEELLNRVNLVYMNDLTNSLRASLMDQVFKHPELSDDQYNALVKYVYTLINYFPFNDDESLKFFKRLHAWLQNQVSPMDINEYKKQFHDIDEALQKREWVACKSLSNTKAVPSNGKKSSSIFENPAQIGKVVSNITRLLRSQHQQANKLKNLFTAFTSNMSPVMLNQNPRQITNASTTVAPRKSNDDPNKKDDSPIERILKSLTSGSLGSDSSILKLISTALMGGGNKDGSTGKSKFAREYPCGAWKLAHVMVVNEYIKDSPRKDVRHIVLQSLYQYMLHFYACTTCGNRVSDVSSEFRLNLDDHLQDQGDSVLLLWKIHNRVNKRLESESRPGSPPKQQFPSEALCPKCRAPRTQNDLASTPNWHDKQVLHFLVHHYRPKNLIINSNSTETSSSSAAYNLMEHHSWYLQLIPLLLVVISHFNLIPALSPLYRLIV